MAASWQRPFLSWKKRPLPPPPATSKEKKAGHTEPPRPRAPVTRSHSPGKCATGLCDQNTGKRWDLRGRWPRGPQCLQKDAIL